MYPYILGYYALKKSNKFPSLEHFIAPVDYSHFENLANKLQDIPFTNLKVEKHKESLTLPSLAIYQKFVNGIAFYQGQVADEEVQLINEALVEYYDMQCQKQYQGKYQFDLTIYLITGIK